MSTHVISKQQAIILIVLVLGGFSFGMAEFITIWLSPVIAAELKTNSSNINSAVSYYAFGVMLGVTLLTSLIKRMSHQKMMTLLLFWCFLGNILTSFVTSWEQLRLARFFSGMPHGMYFGIASMILIQMLPKQRHGFGIGTLMSGIGMALLLIVPVSIYLGDYQNWRIVARAIGLLDLLIIVLLQDLLTEAPPPPDTTANISIWNSLKNPLLWWVAIIGITAFCGRMAVFAYAEPIFLEISKLPKQHLPFAVMVSGIGTILGFILGGILADKHLYRTLFGAFVYCIIATVMFNMLSPYPIGFYLGFFFLSACTVFLPALQLLIIQCSPKAPTFASCLNHGTLNIGNAIGPLLGSYLIVSGFGWLSVTWMGMVFNIITILVLAVGYQHAQKFIAQNNQTS